MSLSRESVWRACFGEKGMRTYITDGERIIYTAKDDADFLARMLNNAIRALPPGDAEGMPSEPQRFDIGYTSLYAVMKPCDDGKWIEQSEYQSLRSHAARVTEERDRLSSTLKTGYVTKLAYDAITEERDRLRAELAAAREKAWPEEPSEAVLKAGYLQHMAFECQPTPVLGEDYLVPFRSIYDEMRAAHFRALATDGSGEAQS